MKLPLALILVLAALLGACQADTSTNPDPNEQLVIAEITVGTGTVASAGNLVSVHYIGTFTNGTMFDNSYTRGQPITFRQGTGAVIRGFDQGVVGMRVGGKRRLTIPPSLGYGSSGQGAVPPNSTLIFEVELVAVS